MFLKNLLPCILLCLSLNAALHAQRRQAWYDDQEIATDYNSCAQGVKDSTGQWVIQPTYDEIYTDHDRYIVSAGGKSGLLDYDGRVLIPLIYDDLRPAISWSGAGGLSGYYCASLSLKDGVVDSVNHIIVPIRYMTIITNYDSTFCCRVTEKTYDIYNLQGTCLNVPWKTRQYPDHDARHTFIITKHTLFGRKYGVIDDSAHIILKREYNDIEANDAPSSIYCKKDKKYGYCSLDGQWIWPMSLDLPKDDWYGETYCQMPGSYAIGPAYSKGHWGLINIVGDTLLPFIYNSVTPLNGFGATDLWEVKVDSLVGVYDAKNGWVLRPESTLLTTFEAFRTSDSTVVAVLVALQKGKWGAITTSGQVILPFVFDDVLMLSTEQHVFIKGDSLYYLGSAGLWDRNILARKISPPRQIIEFYYREYFHNDAELRAIPDSKSFSVFHGDRGVVAYYNPSLTQDSIQLDSATFKSLSTGNKYGMAVPDSILVSSLFFVAPITSSHLRTKLFDSYNPPRLSDDDSVSHYSSFLVMHHKKEPVLTSVASQIAQNHGYDYIITGNDDLIKTDGTMIYPGDSIFDIDDEYHTNDGSMFFTMRKYGVNCAIDTAGKIVVPETKDMIGDFNEKYTWYCSPTHYYQWKLYSNQTKRSVPGKNIFSERPNPIWDSLTIIDNDKSGKRLYNADRNTYLTTYGFNAIIPLSMKGNLFAVKTCGEHIGVMDASGKYVLDTIYEAFTTVEYDTFVNCNDYITEDFFHRFFEHIVFYNSASSVMLDCTTGTVIPRQESLDILWTETEEVIPMPDVELAIGDSFYKYFVYKRLSLYINEADSARMLTWHKQCIADTIYRPARIFDEDTWNYQYPCQYCVNHGFKSESFDWEKNYRSIAYFMIEYQSDSVLSFSRAERRYSWGEEFDKQWFSNVVLFPDGPHQMTLDSLFNPASDWRNFIINTLINYVNTHMGIEGDCHNPAGIPSMLSQQFMFSEDGLLLYPKDFEENDSQLVLTIPWAEVDPYLRMDVKMKLPKQQKN